MSQLTIHNATQQVFEMVLARPVAAPDPMHGQLVHLMWRSPQQGQRLVQVYLNGRLSGSSRSITQRDAWLVVDAGRHVEIELLAVKPSSVAVDLSSALSGVDPPTSPAVSLALFRDVSLPPEARVVIRNEDLGLDQRIALFEPGDPRGGFGAVFGEGGFGYDASTGPGLGYGELGYGPLGSDADALRWRSEKLPTGTHDIELAYEDAAGSHPGTSVGLTIDRLSVAPLNVQLNDQLQLTWT